jgi:hypothetical protein
MLASLARPGFPRCATADRRRAPAAEPHRRLWEIDENLVRNELTDAQRADHHVRREKIMVRMGLVSAPGKGGDRRSTDKLSIGPSYAKQAAASLGVDERTVRHDIARGSKIAPEIMAEVSGTDLDRGVHVLDGAGLGVRNR